jgi:hypothetical protein
MADAALAGLRQQCNLKYQAVFLRARGWFLGQNSLGQPLADVQAGACFDGLQPAGINRNQGAESTLAYLWTELRTSQSQETFKPRTKAAVAGG